MAEYDQRITAQLKETCKITGARWAVWLYRPGGEWKFGLRHGLGKVRQAALSEFIQPPETALWLAGTFSSGRTRSRNTGLSAISLGCERLYVFPNVDSLCALLVGADQLGKSAEAYFRVLAFNAPPDEHPGRLPGEYPNASDRDLKFALTSFELGFETPYNLEDVLRNVLEFLSGIVRCEAALLSVRSGDMFRIEAVWNCPESIRGVELSIQDDLNLSRMVETCEGVILGDAGDRPDLLPKLNMKNGANPTSSWMGVPIVLGQRVIGHLAFFTSLDGGFSTVDLQKVTLQAERLATVIENAIVFAEAARYLQQLALLNELASSASSGVDIEEVAQRVLERLQRTFKTEFASVFLLSSDGRMLHEYGAVTKPDESRLSSDRTNLAELVVETSLPIRIGEIEVDKERLTVNKQQHMIRSEMAVPLKYRGKVIGALALRSTEINAFSSRDEQLLVVIASHLAGLLENMRLNDETRERARNLSLIHEVVQEVVGLTDAREIARIAAELMVNRFSYELACVVLLEEKVESFVAKSSEVTALAGVPEFSVDPFKVSIVSLVLEDGISRLVNDVAQVPLYIPLAEWQAGSEMCVPLKEGERILGVIDVQKAKKFAFSENDLMALEALAGVLSSVILSAHRYQQIQENLRQLHAVRETALDIASDLDFDALLKRVVHRTRELVGARGAELALLDEKEQVVHVVVSDVPWRTKLHEEIPLMAGVAGMVTALGEPLVIDNYNSWKGRLHPERREPYKLVAGVPLKYLGKAIGALTILDDRKKWVFRTEDMQLLELLAPQVTVWIRNARLYQELQARIEAQRTAESKLIRSARLAAVGEMAAGVAHELNNPLTTVTGFVELVLDELSPESPHRPDLELVLREAQRAHGVVRRLLNFSRPVEEQRVRTDLNELVQDVLTLVHHLARTGGVQIAIELTEGLPWISIDPNQIKQVVLNLVHNGIQAMPTGGHLIVNTASKRHEEQDYLTISVRDSGEGISSENLQRIFEPFYTTRPAGSGTGLGLSVSYGIVNEHGGFIDVESQPGKGSCFAVYLPVEGKALDA